MEDGSYAEFRARIERGYLHECRVSFLRQMAEASMGFVSRSGVMSNWAKPGHGLRGPEHLRWLPQTMIEGVFNRALIKEG